jgi:hypothetical protein
MEIIARNVNDAYAQAITKMRHLIITSQPKPSRAGDVYEALNPVVTRYTSPEECVLWDAKRDANPFFHLMEALWMLAGRNDVAFLSNYSKQIASFVDDGTGVQHGAYGHRWRQWFGFDQLNALVQHLQNDPMSRRAVLQMWDPDGDLCERGADIVTWDGIGNEHKEPVWRVASGKDMPCNTSVYFSTRSGALDMMVSNRSNDIILGCYGANAVHFSILQQYMAHRLGVEVGTYTQVSFNWHTYIKTWREKVEPEDDRVMWTPSANPYHNGAAQPVVVDFNDDELLSFLEMVENNAPSRVFESEFLHLVATPMARAHMMWKRDRKEAFTYISSFCCGVGPCPDWLLAAKLWMERRVSC